MRDNPAEMPLPTPVVSFGIACCVLAITLVLVVAIVSRF
jgi:hypothetical protein